ncbi:TetR/AcrR family transcriptional regulator [Patescibacteria group bacterium]|nr:TetR/AcrR family transcriptional regulator [Patescibacteria group bacterium]
MLAGNLFPTMKEIADVAGYTERHIYYCWGTRADLHHAVLDGDPVFAAKCGRILLSQIGVPDMPHRSDELDAWFDGLCRKTLLDKIG